MTPTITVTHLDRLLESPPHELFQFQQNFAVPHEQVAGRKSFSNPPEPMIDVTVQYAVDRRGLPRADTVLRWVQAALKGKKRNASMAIRFVDKKEIIQLNKRFRGKRAPTNVLSFASDNAFGRNPHGLGDIVICKVIIKREAMLQRKKIQAHCAHMVIHGVLHLLGYDHVRARDTLKMERQEIAILATLGYSNPYLPV